ncbi:MAG: carboxymuconolactone decarboxylase family protein [Bacteroidetes bacterium]|nr:carboxymuconolactone decarboxylase family protein [Bacteroidota bacterium]
MKNSTAILDLCELVSCIAGKKTIYIDEILQKMKNKRVNPYKIYESMLQIYLFCGFPATIIGIQAFSKHFKISISKESYNLKIFKARGKLNCKEVYQSNYEKLIHNFDKMSPDLAEWMIVEGYGKVLGRKNLSLKERELVNVAILCTNYYEHQLFSHLKGSMNTGNNKDLIEKVIMKTTKFNLKSNVKNALKLLKKC